MKDPRQFTREEVERLVPEDNGLIQAWIGSHIPDHRKMAITLLQTRLDLERAHKDRDELLIDLEKITMKISGELCCFTGGEEARFTALKKAHDSLQVIISRIEQSKK